MRVVLLRPQPSAVRLDDRAADGEAHAHPVLFRRKERLEYLLRKRDAATAIADLGLDDASHPAHVYPKKSVARDGFHRLHAVADEVDQNLLDLDAIGRDDRKVAFDIDIHTDA